MHKLWAAWLAFLAMIALALRSGKSVSEIVKPYTNKPWYSHLVKESMRFGIPENIALSLVRQESNGNENAIGSSGEIGLFQLKQVVVKDYQQNTGRPIDITRPEGNITVGLWYLSWLKKNWKLSMHDALLAYNSGIGNFLKGVIQDPNYARQIIYRAEQWA